MRLPDPFHVAGEHLAIHLPGASVLFTTRRGGVSRGPYATLNLGRWTKDDPAAVEQNRALLADQAAARLAYGRQIHGNTVTRVTSPPIEGVLPDEADGQATALSQVAPMVLTADCLPIALVGNGAVAMLHAGWRGLAGGVVGEGVRAVGELGAKGPLAAAIGPGAGPCCYEVGDDVRAVFADRGEQMRHGRNLDLKAIARHELARAGVERVHDLGLCTICSDPSLFYSHRRERGVTGRQSGVVWLRERRDG